MNRTVLKNGIRVIYKKIPGSMTSFCIGFEAGANSEGGFPKGTAHALEHVVFKGTKTKSEKFVNEELDRIFAFNNAMTNFPYVIYYGSCSSEDFNEGFGLFSDIINNPSFSEEGFKEEINVILQEEREWKEDFSQYCEDEIFFNSYKLKRINEIIIGNEKSISSMSLENLKNFYKMHYTAENCVITVISSLEFQDIVKSLENFDIRKGSYERVKIPGETNKRGVYRKEVRGFQGAKIQYIFDIQELDNKEKEALKLYSMLLGEGVSSLLFEEIRNNKGYAYDISSEVVREKGIEVFSITTSTSKDRIQEVIKCIDEVLEKSKMEVQELDGQELEVLKKRLILKREFWLERSVELAKYITVNEVMFNQGVECINFKNSLSSISRELIFKTVMKVLNNPSIQILF